ncbi:MAG: hypothetical protein ACLR23_08635 [Clostridia bacterium]
MITCLGAPTARHNIATMAQQMDGDSESWPVNYVVFSSCLSILTIFSILVFILKQLNLM